MSVQSEIERLNQAKNSLKTAIEGKGVTVSDSTKLDGYGNLVEQIESIADVPIYNGETDPATPGGESSPVYDGKLKLYITITPNAILNRPPTTNKVTLYLIGNSSADEDDIITIDWGDDTDLETIPNGPGYKKADSRI